MATAVVAAVVLVVGGGGRGVGVGVWVVACRPARQHVHVNGEVCGFAVPGTVAQRLTAKLAASRTASCRTFWGTVVGVSCSLRARQLELTQWRR